MGFKTWAVGEILKAVDINQYLAKQVIAVVTSSTRPESPVEGQMIYETDTQCLVLYTGSHWEVFSYHGPFKEYTPEWTATTTNPSIGNGTLRGYYRRLPGRTVHLRITWSRGTTTNMGSGAYSISLPPELPAETGTRWFGTGMFSLDPNEASIFSAHPVIFAGSDGTKIDRIRWDDQGSDGIENWTDAGPTVSADWYAHFQILYETTAIDSNGNGGG